MNNNKKTFYPLLVLVCQKHDNKIYLPPKKNILLTKMFIMKSVAISLYFVCYLLLKQLSFIYLGCSHPLKVHSQKRVLELPGRQPTICLFIDVFAALSEHFLNVIFGKKLRKYLVFIALFLWLYPNGLPAKTHGGLILFTRGTTHCKIQLSYTG